MTENDQQMTADSNQAQELVKKEHKDAFRVQYFLAFLRRIWKIYVDFMCEETFIVKGEENLNKYIKIMAHI